MNVVLLQTEIQWLNIDCNIQHAEMLMAEHPVADLYVLPEMWSTGFVVEESLAIEEEGHSKALAWMKRMAVDNSCALCGSIAVRVDDGTCRNRFYFVTPDGISYYDKRHLFTSGREDKIYRAGQSRTIVEWKGVRFLLQTCYDLRFPLWSRYGMAGEYDAIIYVANWPRRRQRAWDVLTHARAIENQCYVIACNRVGEDPVTHYQGGSILIDPTGHNVVCDRNKTELSLFGQLSIESLLKARQHFPVLNDRDVYPMV